MGFRPFVARLAGELGIRGFVRNTEGGVEIEAEGPAVDEFVVRLRADAPDLATIADLTVCELEHRGDASFEIRESAPCVGDFALVPPDIAVTTEQMPEFIK